MKILPIGLTFAAAAIIVVISIPFSSVKAGYTGQQYQQQWCGSYYSYTPCQTQYQPYAYTNTNYQNNLTYYNNQSQYMTTSYMPSYTAPTYTPPQMPSYNYNYNANYNYAQSSGYGYQQPQQYQQPTSIYLPPSYGGYPGYPNNYGGYANTGYSFGSSGYYPFYSSATGMVPDCKQSCY